MTPPPGSPSSPRDGGFSLLEVVIAIAILMTVLVSVSSLLQTAFKVGANSRYRQEATEIASSTLDGQLATGATTLLGKTGDTALPSVTSSGQVYLLEMEVAPFDPGNSGCQSPASDPGAMLKVSIWATWTDQASGSTWWLAGSSSASSLLVEETSLVAVPSSAINPNMGSILVTIQGATAQAIAGLSVTATPSSGSAQTVTTTAGGCALFANIAASPTTWTISFGTLPGYLTEQNASTLPSQGPLSLTAGTTTSLYFEPSGTTPYNAYDKEATVTPVYTVPMADGVHPILPTNISSMPLSFYSANLTVSPYVTSSPGLVFPMSSAPSYYVVAGSCGAESAPGGGSVAGQPVTLTAGGTASPTVNLVPLQIFVNQGGSLVGSATSPATVTAQPSNAAGTGADANCPTTGAGVMPMLSLGNTTTVWSSFHRGRKQPTDAILVSGCTSNCVTTTTLTSSVNPSTSGASVTFTATVACSPACSSPTPGTTPTGTVTFKDNGSTLGSGTLSGGVATYTTSALAFGSHPITASYAVVAGKWAASTSSTVTQVVTSPTATALSATPNPNSYGTSTNLSATVTCSASGCGTPTGTVTFTDNGVNIGGCVGVTVTAGVAPCTLSGLNGGSYSVVAVYTPSANYQASTSSTVTEQINAASTVTVLTSSANPSTFNSSVTLTATVTPASGAPAVGSVAFKDGATVLATVALNGSGIATYATSTFTVGTHSLSAVFTATNPSNFGPSTGTLSQVVNAPAGTPYTLCGLPYGVWLLSATYTNAGHTYTSTTESVQVVITITTAGIYIGAAGPYPAGSSVTVNVQ
ncbi:MAG TPA: Ig-like domain-containing protein [Acidimicrobiales bacterium]|nr:Ig-like domain-containing protein [Acidimicrobiales bacterium]